MTEPPLGQNNPLTNEDRPQNDHGPMSDRAAGCYIALAGLLAIALLIAWQVVGYLVRYAPMNDSGTNGAVLVPFVIGIFCVGGSLFAARKSEIAVAIGVMIAAICLILFAGLNTIATGR